MVREKLTDKLFSSRVSIVRNINTEREFEFQEYARGDLKQWKINEENESAARADCSWARYLHRLAAVSRGNPRNKIYASLG